jgi:hypothetical protein
MAPADALSTLLAIAVALFALAWLSRQISLHTQLVAYFFSRSQDFAALAIFLLFLPGIFVHELAHWISARLLGLRASKFRVWPKRQGSHIGLGSVSVQRGGTWRDSMVGLAPLFAGTAICGLIGALALQSDELLWMAGQGRVMETVDGFVRGLGNADGLLWAYLLFAVGNSMMPSRSDREPARLLLLYLAFAALIYIVVGLPADPFTTLLSWVGPAFQSIAGALLFLLILDLIVLLVLLLIELPFRWRR